MDLLKQTPRDVDVEMIDYCVKNPDVSFKIERVDFDSLYLKKKKQPSTLNTFFWDIILIFIILYLSIFFDIYFFRINIIESIHY